MCLRRPLSALMVFWIVALSVSMLGIQPVEAGTPLQITGTVMTATGIPIAGATVTDSASNLVYTDAQGQYALQELQLGTYTVNASKPGMADRTAQVVLSATSPWATQNFTMVYISSSSVNRRAISTASNSFTIVLTLSTYAPNPGVAGQAGATCAVVTDSRSGSTASMTFNSAAGGQNVWTWSEPLPQNTTEGVYQLTARVQDCSSGLQVDTGATTSYTVDNAGPVISPASIRPSDFGYTVFVSEPLIAALTDNRAGIDPSTVVFTITDGNGNHRTFPSTSFSAPWAATGAVSLVQGSSYVVSVSASDYAGNTASATEANGFSVTTASPASGTSAAIPAVTCSVANQTGLTGTKTATCPNVAIDLAQTTVTVGGDRYAAALGYVEQTVPLTTAIISSTVAGAAVSIPAYQSGDANWAPKVASMPYPVSSPSAAGGSYDVPQHSVVVGTLVTKVPGTWTTASLSMAQTSTTASIATCANPLAASPTFSCEPDPLQYGYRVLFKSSVTDPIATADAEATKYNLRVQRVAISPPGYTADVPLPQLARLRADVNVASVTRYAGPSVLTDLMANYADTVVKGTVQSAGTQVAGTDGSPADTLVPVAVQASYKGSATGTINVRIHTGTVGSLTVRQTDDPILTAGEEAGFFLVHQTDGSYRPALPEISVIPGLIESPDGPQVPPVPQPLDLILSSATVADGCYDSDAQGSYYRYVPMSASWSAASETFKLNSTNSYPATQQQVALDSAMADWNGVGAAFRMIDGGPPALSGFNNDMVNAISFESHPEFTWSGLTRVYTSGTSIVQADVIFNTARMPSDVASVARHEFGHTLGLAHVNDPAQVMFPTICGTKGLAFGDRAGIGNIYPPNTQGYWLVDKSGAVYSFGGLDSKTTPPNAQYYGGANQGNAIGYPTNSAVAIEVHRPTRRGYWILADNGGIFTFGDAPFVRDANGQGSAANYLCCGHKAVGMASTPSGNGYWILDNNGAVYAFGDATYRGGANGALPSGSSAVGIAAKPDGTGYWIVNSKGEIYSFGAPYLSSSLPSLPPSSQPAVGIQSSITGNGYWILGNDGGVFSLGDAPFQGSNPGWGNPRGFSRDPLGNGYAWTAPNADVANHGLFYYGRGTNGCDVGGTCYAAMAITDRP